MKNITSFKNINIKNVLITLILIFNIHLSFSQVDLRTCGYSCTSNNYTLTDVFLSLSNVNGTPITNTTCTIGQVQQVYIYLNYSSNSSSSIHYARLNSDLQINGVTTFLNVLLGDIVPGSNKKLIYGPFNWTCGDELSLENTIIAWKTNKNNDPGPNYTCSSYTNSQCDYTNTFTISKPLAVQFTYKACTVGTNITVSFTSTTNGGKTPYTYAWDFKNDGGAPDSTLPNPTYTYTTSNNTAKLTVTDSQNLSNSYILPIIAPTELILSETHTTVSCGGGTSNITLGVTGGTPGYSYLWSNGAVTKDLNNVAAGTYTVTVTDSNNCSKQLTVTIPSGDSIKPVIDPLPDPTTINCPEIPVFAQATATDNSGTVTSLTYTDQSTPGSCTGTYSITRTWTAKDACDNTSLPVSQTINIVDVTAPAWTTQSGSLNQTVECSNAEALAAAQALFPAAADLCDADVSNIEKVSGQFTASEGCSNAGTYTNTWTVKDDCGNTSDTFTQVITIEDTAAPVWSTQAGSLNITLQCTDTEGLNNAQTQVPIATDNCDGTVSYTKTSGQFTASEGCLNAGTYTNSWIAKDDCGNVTDSFIQVITIEDTTPPAFTGNLPTDITVSCDAVPEPANIEASDNCSGNLPIVFSETKSNILNECGTDYTLTRIWSTSDCSGNPISHTQIITVRDTTPPTGTAPADAADLQSIANIPAASPQDIIDAADNCSNTVTITISDSNNGASGCEGNAYILTRTYTLTDCSGNKTELVQTFTVENKVSVTGIATNVTCFGKSDGSILVTNSPGSTVVITNDKNEVVGNTNLPAGTYTLTATSAVNGENQTCTATATVVITQPDYTIKISGYVMNADSHSGIPNVMVTLIPQGTTTGPILLHLTGPDGGYSFTGMPAGSYLVQVQDANLNSVYQLYPVDSSLFFTTLEDCIFQEHTFNYGTSTLPVLGDYVWYDANSNGIQDEWYDANNDGVVTKNIPDAGGAVDYSLWEWIDLNGDGSYQGPLNVGELNAGGFGNALSPNIIVDGPNGYHKEVIIGIMGFWRDRPNSENPYGDYTIKLVKDANLDAMATALGVTGLVKVLPNLAAKTGKTQLHTVCSITSPSSYIVTVTPQDLVHLDADFGINCKEYQDIAANDDNAGPIAGVNHTTTNVLNVLVNDTLEGNAVTVSDVIITTVTPNEFLQLNTDGSVDVLPNAPVGTLTLVYQICEADQTSNCDTATVTITIEAPVVANDDVYANIGCNTFGLVGNVLSNDFKGQIPATLELVDFTLLAENENNATTDPNITIDNQGNVTVSSLTPAGTYTYTYRICDKLIAENCDTAVVTITVVPSEIVNITSEACNDDSSLVNLSSLLPEGTPITGTWIDTNNTNALQGNDLNPFGLVLGNYTFEYKIVDENCPRSILLNMEINNDCQVLACGNILVHNAFSPNGDGINDVFVIDSIDDLTCYPGNTVEIYNRWGILVFETSNYNNTTNAFDGTSRGRTTVKKSDGLPSGTYFYILNYKSLNGNNEIQNNEKDGYLYLSK